MNSIVLDLQATNCACYTSGKMAEIKSLHQNWFVAVVPIVGLLRPQ